jgi:hypothetical protein
LFQKQLQRGFYLIHFDEHKKEFGLEDRDIIISYDGMNISGINRYSEVDIQPHKYIYFPRAII